MFLVQDKIGDAIYLVFTGEDPRRSGYAGNMIDNVALDYDMEAVHQWKNGDAAPEARVGRDPLDARRFKVFRNTDELRLAGYEPVAGDPVVFALWTDYLKLRTMPPGPDTPDEYWYDYLDELDKNAREWRRRAPDTSEPISAARDDVAKWVAKKHFIADSGIREIWYLPQEAPTDEIRLLEVNDRFVVNDDGVAAIDFDLNVKGAPFLLRIADMSTEQLNQVKQDPARLPAGWSLAGGQVWRRRGA
ncbi:MAG TPA: hypothetical protein VF278_04540 [Pirellulales bacterium]